MTSQIIRTNYTNNQLYCTYSKEKIALEEKYITVFDNYCGDWIEKYYKLEYKDFIDETEK